MAENLEPCPWCGAGQTTIHVNKGVWNGRGFGDPVSVEVRHWCAEEIGQPSRMISRVGRDEASAIAAWNRRALTAENAALREDAWRYRFIRPMSFVRPLNVVDGDLTPLNDSELDSVIDAAIASAKEKGNG